MGTGLSSFLKSAKFTAEDLALNGYFLWFYLVCITDFDVASATLTHYLQTHPGLLHVRDSEGRSVLDVASQVSKPLIHGMFLWFGKYRPIDHRPEHVSETTIVYKCFDDKVLDEYGNPTRVVLKLMRVKEHYKQEIQLREKNFSSTFVLNVLDNYPPIKEIDAWPDISSLSIENAGTVMLSVMTKSVVEQFFCIVMPLGDRNMYVALKQEIWPGSNMSEISHVFAQIVNCVDHMHSKGIVHCDIKPLNLIRAEGTWKLIDLDCATFLGSPVSCSKVSTAYSPPESICLTNGLHDESFLSEYSTDIWALGCLLFQLCHPSVRPLFEGGKDDKLCSKIGSRNSTWELTAWTDERKGEAMAEISDNEARNLISLMLCRDRSKRPSINRIRTHPFITKKRVTRMRGDAFAFDAFISYRVKSDLNFVTDLYNMMEQQSTTVWWDKMCLEKGLDFSNVVYSQLIGRSRNFFFRLELEGRICRWFDEVSCICVRDF